MRSVLFSLAASVALTASPAAAYPDHTPAQLLSAAHEVCPMMLSIPDMYKSAKLAHLSDQDTKLMFALCSMYATGANEILKLDTQAVESGADPRSIRLLKGLQH